MQFFWISRSSILSNDWPINPFVRISLRSYLRIRLSVLPIAHIYLSVPSVSALPSIRPSGPSVHLSTSTRPSRVTPPNCMRACVHTYPIYSPIYPTCPRKPSLSYSLSLSCLLSFSPSLYLSIYLSLPFRSRSPSSASRSPTWILHAASIDLQNDLSRARSTRSPLPRVPRESRGFPETWFSLARMSRGRAGDGIRKRVRARSRPTAHAAVGGRRTGRRLAAGPLPGEADSPRRWTPRCCARLLT